MSPILLDEKKIIQLALLFIAALILAFSSGYFLAYKTPLKKAEKDIAASTTNDALINKSEASQPAAAKPKQKTTAKKIPEKTSQKKSTPVKKEKKINNKSKATKKSSSKNKNPSAKKSTATKKTPKPIKKPKAIVTKKVPAKTSTINNKDQLTKISDANTASNKSEKNKIEKEPRFSIQVGVFDRQENAQKLVDEIKAKGFDAYISEYVSSKGFAKYNVRFGHFTERAEGRKRLDAFKQHFSLSAYIIINQ